MTSIRSAIRPCQYGQAPRTAPKVSAPPDLRQAAPGGHNLIDHVDQAGSWQHLAGTLAGPIAPADGLASPLGLFDLAALAFFGEVACD